MFEWEKTEGIPEDVDMESCEIEHNGYTLRFTVYRGKFMPEHHQGDYKMYLVLVGGSAMEIHTSYYIRKEHAKKSAEGLFRDLKKIFGNNGFTFYGQELAGAYKNLRR